MYSRNRGVWVVTSSSGSGKRTLSVTSGFHFRPNLFSGEISVFLKISVFSTTLGMQHWVALCFGGRFSGAGKRMEENPGVFYSTSLSRITKVSLPRAKKVHNVFRFSFQSTCFSRVRSIVSLRAEDTFCRILWLPVSGVPS